MIVEDVPVKPPAGWVINSISTIKRNTGAVELFIFMQKPDPERKTHPDAWPELRFDAKFDSETEVGDEGFWQGVMAAVSEFDATLVPILP